MILGIDIGGTSIAIGKLKNNQLIERKLTPTPFDKNLKGSLSLFIEMITPFICSKTKGIGIGVPSVVDTSKGIVYNVANIPSWEEVHLKDILEEKFNIPVKLNNDANCFVSGLKSFGEAKDYNNIIGITLGTGVGAGVIINGKLYEGINTSAGEIGEMPYLDSIFEHYCASMFFTKKKTSGKEAFNLAQQGDKNALKLWEEFGFHLGKLVRTVLLAYDPEIIVFGGSITDAYSFFEEGMSRSLDNFPFPKSLEQLIIKISKNPDIAILGATALVNNLK